MELFLFVLAVVCALLSWGLSVAAYQDGRDTAGVMWLLLAIVVALAGVGFLVS